MTNFHSFESPLDGHVGYWVCTFSLVFRLLASRFGLRFLQFNVRKMAESQEQDEDLGLTPGYKAPAQKSLVEISNQDQEDESLRRYKEALLGNVGALPSGDGGGKKVVLQKLTVVVEGRKHEDNISLDLTGDLSKFKDTPIVIKEGASYRLKVDFKCPSEIVAGLRFITTIHKMGVKVNTLKYMVGSYGPNTPEKPVHSYTAEVEEAPHGLPARGKYKAKSVFTDDDQVKHLEWQWVLEIKKHWPDEKETK